MVNNPTIESYRPRRAILAGTGSCVPDKILTNEDFTKIVDTSDEWITTRTGIKTRHIAQDGEARTLRDEPAGAVETGIVEPDLLAKNRSQVGEQRVVSAQVAGQYASR